MFSEKYVEKLIKRSKLQFPMQIEHKLGYYDQDKIRYYAGSIQELLQICYNILEKAVFVSEFDNSVVPDTVDEYANQCEEWQKVEYFNSVAVSNLADQGLLKKNNSYVEDAVQRIKNMQDEHNQAKENRERYEIVMKILDDKNGPHAFAAVNDFMNEVVRIVPIERVVIDPAVVKDWA
jgi:hypothetical protein